MACAWLNPTCFFLAEASSSCSNKLKNQRKRLMFFKYLQVNMFMKTLPYFAQYLRCLHSQEPLSVLQLPLLPRPQISMLEMVRLLDSETTFSLLVIVPHKCLLLGCGQLLLLIMKAHELLKLFKKPVRILMICISTACCSLAASCTKRSGEAWTIAVKLRDRATSRKKQIHHVLDANVDTPFLECCAFHVKSKNNPKSLEASIKVSPGVKKFPPNSPCSYLSSSLYIRITYNTV